MLPCTTRPVEAGGARLVDRSGHLPLTPTARQTVMASFALRERGQQCRPRRQVELAPPP
jgi:hypothetical protein